MAGLSFDLVADEITPSLKRLAAGDLRERILMGMGTVIQSHGQRSFDEAGLRPAPWAKRKSGGSHPLLIKSGDLRQGIHVTKAGGDSVKIGSPAKYAAAHQFGATIVPKDPSGVLAFEVGGKTVYVKKVEIPARPFMPFVGKTAKLTGNAQEEIQEVVDVLMGDAARGV